MLPRFQSLSLELPATWRRLKGTATYAALAMAKHVLILIFIILGNTSRKVIQIKGSTGFGIEVPKVCAHVHRYKLGLVRAVKKVIAAHMYLQRSISTHVL